LGDISPVYYDSVHGWIVEPIATRDFQPTFLPVGIANAELNGPDDRSRMRHQLAKQPPCSLQVLGMDVTKAVAAQGSFAPASHLGGIGALVYDRSVSVDDGDDVEGILDERSEAPFAGLQ